MTEAIRARPTSKPGSRSLEDKQTRWEDFGTEMTRRRSTLKSNDHTDRMSRIGVLARKNAGQAQSTEFLQSLHRTLGIALSQADLADLETTDAAYREFTERYRAASIGADAVAYRRSYRKAETPSPCELTDCGATLLGKEPVLLLSKQSERCGAVLLNAETALSGAAGLLLLDGDSLILVSRQSGDGLMLDWRCDEEEAFELTVWGERWASIFSGCAVKLQDRRPA